MDAAPVSQPLHGGNYLYGEALQAVGDIQQTLGICTGEIFIRRVAHDLVQR